MNIETRICQNCKTRFTIEPEDFQFYEKIKAPPPTWCPECRMQRRFAWANQRSIYRRKCDLCGKEKIGVYSPDKPFKVYCSTCWWSDKWDALEYGRDYDFSRPFFEQFYELMKEVPLLNRFVFESTMVNSDYTNMANDLKDCYLLFHAEFCERCMYSEDVMHTNDSVDVSFVEQSELCYESFNLQKCSRVHFSSSSEECSDSYFLKDCVNCRNCFGCVNLRNKEYHIFNKPYTKENYFAELKKLGFDSASHDAIGRFRKQAYEFYPKFPVKYTHTSQNVKVSGDFIFNSKNTHHSFNCYGIEDSKFCSFLTVPQVRDSYDWTIYGENGELMYEILQAGREVYNNKFGWCIWIGTRDIKYGILNVDASDCLGCVSVRKKKYCILNKQYTKEEYEKLIPRIIKHINEMPYVDKKGRVYKYGEFLPPELSPFAYNETMAQQYLPLSKRQAVEQGYIWKNPEERNYEVTVEPSDLPDDIKEAKDDIINQIIGCEHQAKCNEQCTTAFRIIPQELEFYRKMNLPLPRLCSNCRHYQRIKQRNPLKLWHRKCTCGGTNSDPSTGSGYIYTNQTSHFHGSEHCPNEFETSYAPERQEIVYCEACYQSEAA